MRIAASSRLGPERPQPEWRDDRRARGTFRIGGDLEVTRLGYGAMRITGDGIWGPAPAPESAAPASALPRGLLTATMSAMEITCVTFDCADPVAIASFWNDALGWGGVRATDGGTGAICGPSSGGWYLEFVQVPEPKVTKNRVHLGCSTGRLDALDAEIDRLCRLGASRAWEEAFPREVARRYRNVVLRDPEGNEFCLSAGEPPA